MHITYLGHAGFLVETRETLVVMDPWLSATGAFDASWFQMPRNHHLAPVVREKLSSTNKAVFIYVSHEHRDHLDLEFLKSLPSRRFTLMTPAFCRDALAAHFSGYECDEQIFFYHRQRVEIPGGFIKLYVDDSQLNRDSAILLRADGDTFLNLNDCKLFDALPRIVQEDGPIKVFACQFSGATWHPTCYEYPPERYEVLSRKKFRAKFESVAKAIELVRPEVYIPSAGPVCFLDPVLQRLNSEKVNIFPRARMIIEYLKTRLRYCTTNVPEMMPGDSIDTVSGHLSETGTDRFEESTAQAYIDAYAASYTEFFSRRVEQQKLMQPSEVVEKLRAELLRKLGALSLASRVGVPLYIGLDENPSSLLHVDFQRKVVETVATLPDSHFYSMRAPAWQIAMVLGREITWEEFSLTFRARLRRDPDTYDPILHAFLVMETEDLGRYCDLILDIEAQADRLIVEAEGRQYSVRRYCPHQGGDLAEGWLEKNRFLVCPRHRWQFDLLDFGRCTTNDLSIGAVCLKSDTVSASELTAIPEAPAYPPTVPADRIAVPGLDTDRSTQH